MARRQLCRDQASELGAFLRRGAHQRDGRVVHVEIALRELGRDGVARAEVDHVEGAQRHDLRQALASGHLQALGTSGKDAADQLVAQLRGGDIEDSDEEAAVGQRLHRAPAGAGGVEDEDLVAAPLQLLARRRDARRRDAEHGGADQRALLAQGDIRGVDHARHRGRGVGQDASRDRVHPGRCRPPKPSA